LSLVDAAVGVGANVSVSFVAEVILDATASGRWCSSDFSTLEKTIRLADLQSYNYGSQDRTLFLFLVTSRISGEEFQIGTSLNMMVMKRGRK
jgi:hypothetical protein